MESPVSVLDDPLACDQAHFLGYLLARMKAVFSQPGVLRAWLSCVEDALRPLDPWDRSHPFSLYMPTRKDEEKVDEEGEPILLVGQPPLTPWCQAPHRCPASVDNWRRLVADCSHLRAYVPLFPGDGLFGSHLERSGRELAQEYVDAMQSASRGNASLEALDRVVAKLNAAFKQALRIHPGYQAVRRYVRCHKASHAAREMGLEAQLAGGYDTGRYPDPAFGCTVHESLCTWGKERSGEPFGPPPALHTAFHHADALKLQIWKEIGRAQKELDKERHDMERIVREEQQEERKRVLAVKTVKAKPAIGPATQAQAKRPSPTLGKKAGNSKVASLRQSMINARRNPSSILAL